MVGLSQLVSESFARHGVEANLDPRHLRWSKWIPCESCLSFADVPDKGGIFALAEELIGPGEVAGVDGKRMLAVYQVAEADHLGLAMGRLFLRGPEAKRLASGRHFARYAIVEDAAQRRTAYAAFRQWMASSVQATTGIGAAAEAASLLPSSNNETQIGPPEPLPSGF